MSVDVHRRLAELGFQLPCVSPPKGVYAPAVCSGRYVYVSGQVPMVDGELAAVGKVGAEVSVERARELSGQCGLAALAAVDAVIGLDAVVRVVKVVGYVSSAEGFTDQSRVVDGASDLFVAVFGDAGRHARSAVGVGVLPLGAPVEIEVLVEVTG
ncbi:RidA family protein [Streptomyces sp. NBC_01381]|uniref:RidA family protein n=1 Tax=Streptomyces sp. NBC_01381 TaxID=2903845 RepID=UPI002254ED39|nr:RidA family protein [Streptomyces sp. NBC_01381]MCX4672340.1 RidA family protein [Streptomyces sp. NBC_01381]